MPWTDLVPTEIEKVLSWQEKIVCSNSIIFCHLYFVLLPGFLVLLVFHSREGSHFRLIRNNCRWMFTAVWSNIINIVNVFNTISILIITSLNISSMEYFQRAMKEANRLRRSPNAMVHNYLTILPHCLTAPEKLHNQRIKIQQTRSSKDECSTSDHTIT